MSENYQYKKKYNEKYLAKMDEIRIRMPKESGLKETIQTHAESRGESVQAFIIRAITETIERDTRND
jgi:oligoribonuclease (3'-5' exoribonuclease)